jgi:hypothetical protein
MLLIYSSSKVPLAKRRLTMSILKLCNRVKAGGTVLWDIVSFLTGSWDIAQPGLEFVILLPQPPECGSTGVQYHF